MIEDILESAVVRRHNKWLSHYSWWRAFCWSMKIRTAWRESLAKENIAIFNEIREINKIAVLTPNELPEYLKKRFPIFYSGYEYEVLKKQT